MSITYDSMIKIPWFLSFNMLIIYCNKSTKICPNNKLAKDISLSEKHRVFRYVVTNHPSQPVSMNGFPPSKYAVHFWDSAALFNYKMTNNYSLSETDKLFKKNLRDNIKHFMVYGHVKFNLE